MDSNGQEMVKWYGDIVSLAARHHLMVDFHGAFEPTGLRVTWPNLLTREGVLGNEYNKFSTRVTPLHKLTLPFTRMLLGPMDYTPGGFLNRSPSAWKQTTPTEVMGSRAQELALFVVYWSPLTCVTDDPVNYKDQPGLEFLRVVPTVWDETKVLDGAVGEHIVMARRRGQQWFSAG
jgi:alpha-glucosidase